MTVETMIKMALAYRNMSQAAVAKELDTTLSNFNQKLKKETFSREELEKIAAVLGANFKQYFEFPDGTKIGSVIETMAGSPTTRQKLDQLKKAKK